MVSTYLSYNLVVRDLKASMTRTANETMVKRDNEYYQQNIGKVKSIDDFLKDYRLYSYAMTAHGLEDMIYAKAFMKKVLESDLSDENSYANKLTDTRYREFATAFQFGSGTKIPQSEQQTDQMIGLYNSRIDDLDSVITADTGYYNAMLPNVSNVDEFLANSRLRDYMFKAYDIDPQNYDRTLIRNLLLSDVNDPNSYFSTEILPKVIAAQDALNDAAPQLDKLNKRDAYLDDVAGLQQSIDDITNARVNIVDLQIQLGEPGADTAAIQKQIDGLQRGIESTIQDFVGGKITDMTKQITDLEAQKTQSGADVPALQAQIDAIQTDVDHWQADYDSRTSIADKHSQIDTLEASKSASGADITAIDQQIADLQSEISNLQGTLEPVDIGDMEQMRDARQAAADALTADGLPAPGTDSDALRTQLTKSKTEAANYLIIASRFEKLASAYQFNADGSVPADGIQTEENRKTTNENYVFKQDRLTRAGAMLNDAYFREKINTFTTVDEMMSDTRIVGYLKAAFGLSTYGAIVSSTLENAITTPATDTDLEDANNYLVKFYKGRDYYQGLVDLARAFNFNTDGTLPAGVLPLDPEKFDMISSGYYSGYDDVAESADTKAVTALKSALDSFNTTNGKIANVEDLVNNSAVYDFAMKAVGLDAGTIPKRVMKQVLSSDLQDPKSFVYSLKDDRYVQFAKLFNFDKDGKLTWARMAQAEDTLQTTAKDYIVHKTRFLVGKEKEAAKTAAEKESKYYQEKIATISTLKEFLSDRRLVDVALVAKGIDPSKVTDDYIKKIFQSDLDDPKSFARTEKDYRFAELAASFNFDKNGNVIRTAGDQIQTSGEIMSTMNLYLRQTIETTQGEENAGVRLALYFERKAGEITSAYDILADDALAQVFRTTFSLPDEIASMDIDQQAKLVDKYLKLQDLNDPDKLSAMLKRFTIMYDLANDTSSSAVVSILGGGSTGISGDTLMAIASLSRR